MSTPAPHLDPFIQNWNRIHKQSARLMATAPDDKYEWKTCDSAMTLGELLNHLYQAEAGLVQAALSGQFSPEAAPAPQTGTEDLVAAFNKSHEEMAAKVAALTPEQLQEEIMPFGEKVGAMTRGALLHIMCEHEVHHRGQLYVYLRMLGVEVPPLYGA